ncbi:hypothetical protein [Agarivorans gilvus]|uniref:Glycosyl hydrolase 36 catalytic domain-containing protein n=1 Tax=Agarivorans gilvus TaxID=680279 RepID=A0ABQ1I6L9_9ALTE|nr:hypothetical protein [Agarivorans gilvus]GGB18202.1 hypothetical protein GCM10007414_34520 [Agarivorans gilvus]
MHFDNFSEQKVVGQFVDLAGERYYKIANVDQMAPFFISVVSASDHWLFISSTGSLSAGRIRPENALFPYKSVDYIHESAENTGSKTLVRVNGALWEPFNRYHDGLYQLERNLYKNTTGDKLLFEELNHSLGVKFQYSWQTSEQYGFVRQAEISNIGEQDCDIEIVDGIQNIQPSGAPLSTMQSASSLVDAYKWNERLEQGPLVLYTMYAKLSDRAEPLESLLASSVFSLDSDDSQILLSSKQLNAFRRGQPLNDEHLIRGERGSYLLAKSFRLPVQQQREWLIVADIDKNHRAVSQLQAELASVESLTDAVKSSVAANQQELANLMSGADAWQLSAEENTSVHHYANVLFNSMRGGVFENGYILDKTDVINTLKQTNREVTERYLEALNSLPEQFSHQALMALAKQSNDAQLLRLCDEYIPLTFGRRHGDPSRPWNHFEIKLKDDAGQRLLSYQGNWRDIFQNWEALALSYPGYISSFLAKFVNASTADGYNPYRITKQGIDWEKPESDDPWSNIGYWGDHQIIYLLKFLEQFDKYQHDQLLNLLISEQFSYANVPYRLSDVDQLLANPKDTVSFDEELDAVIQQRVATMGSDGRLLLDAQGQVYQVNLMEKILVPLLTKLSNLVIDGGIWLNTQRPEWNDANNAIVGNGLSMVTLYYMRRYVSFMQQLLADAPEEFSLSAEVAQWLDSTSTILQQALNAIEQNAVNDQQRYSFMLALQNAANDYRQKVYSQQGFSAKASVQQTALKQLMTVSLSVLDASIANNLRPDGLYNAYNILSLTEDKAEISYLYPMLEGQVAILSAGVLSPEQAVTLTEQLYNSDMYRADQHTFMLYPDRDLNGFMQKNIISAELIAATPALQAMVSEQDQRIVMLDEQGNYRFHAACDNSAGLSKKIEQLKADYSHLTPSDWKALEKTYEQVFNHKAFTGRSGTMFGYEGLGCIYWHMVSKLLLAVQENYLKARELDAASPATQRLAQLYYQVRQGIGFNKTPDNYGAFPCDPYSHTPKQAGAQQPGMTGQVKEEVISRFTELGIEVANGAINIKPSLLKANEFLSQDAVFHWKNLAGEDRQCELSAGQLAFTLCQVPFVYTCSDDSQPAIVCHLANGETQQVSGLSLPQSLSQQLFARLGEIVKVEVSLNSQAIAQF